MCHGGKHSFERRVDVENRWSVRPGQFADVETMTLMLLAACLRGLLRYTSGIEQKQTRTESSMKLLMALVMRAPQYDKQLTLLARAETMTKYAFSTVRSSTAFLA